MSTRAIAPTVGIRSDQTIRADLAKVRDHHAPESLGEYRGHVLRDAETNHKVIKLTGPESVSDPAPARVVGLDGKTYTRPAPKETTKETTMTGASSAPPPGFNIIELSSLASVLGVEVGDLLRQEVA